MPIIWWRRRTYFSIARRSSQSVREQAADARFYIEGQALTIPVAALAYLADISDMTSAQNFLHCQAVQFLRRQTLIRDCTSNKVLTFP